jgi:hypothetical protein
VIGSSGPPVELLPMQLKPYTPLPIAKHAFADAVLDLPSAAAVMGAAQSAAAASTPAKRIQFDGQGSRRRGTPPQRAGASGDSREREAIIRVMADLREWTMDRTHNFLRWIDFIVPGRHRHAPTYDLRIEKSLSTDTTGENRMVLTAGTYSPVVDDGCPTLPLQGRRTIRTFSPL